MGRIPLLVVGLGLLSWVVAVPPPARTAEYQFEDNLRDLLDSARNLVAKDELEEAAIEYENVMQIDPAHRDAALAAFDVYLKLGAVPAAEELLGRFGRMGVDSNQQAALKAKLDGVKATPPPKRKRIFTPAVLPAGATAAGGVAPAPVGPAAASDGLDELDDLGGGPGAAPAPVAPGSPAPPKPGAPPAGKDDLDDIGL